MLSSLAKTSLALAQASTFQVSSDRMPSIKRKQPTTKEKETHTNTKTMCEKEICETSTENKSQLFIDNQIINQGNLFETSTMNLYRKNPDTT